MYKNRKLKSNLKVIKENQTPSIVEKRRSIEIEADVGASSSEEKIPASQEPVVRYLSQRSILQSSLSRTQSSSVCNSQQCNSYFELVLSKAGVQWAQGDDDAAVINYDHIVFMNNVQRTLLKAHNHPENLDIFKSGLAQALAPNAPMATKLLQAATVKSRSQTPGQTFQSQHSLLQSLLMIEMLRDDVLGVLLAKIEKIACANGDRQTPPTGFLSMLLVQLRDVATMCRDAIYAVVARIFKDGSELARTTIIANAEFILDASKHDAFVELLLGQSRSLAQPLHEPERLFKSATIDTLNNLSLSADTTRQLCARITDFAKTQRCAVTLLPDLVKFLVQNLKQDEKKDAQMLVLALRDIFKDREFGLSALPQQRTMLMYMRQALLRGRELCAIWQRIIAVLPASQFAAFDLVTLLMVFGTSEQCSAQVKKTLRKHIRQCSFDGNILQELKVRLPAALEELAVTLTVLLNDLVQDRDELVCGFAKSVYSALFGMCAAVQKTVLQDLVKLTFDKNARHLAADILTMLHRKYKAEFKSWNMIMTAVLDRIEEMSLTQTRTVMKLLCAIAFPPPDLAQDCPDLQNQVDSLIRKQLISGVPSVQRQGIVGSVQLIDSIARTQREYPNMDDFNVSFNTVNSLPDGRGKMAANCFIRTHSVVLPVPELLALFYDELNTAIEDKYYYYEDNEEQRCPDTYFLIWFCELVTFYFQSNYVAEHDLQPIAGIELEYKGCINSREDTMTHSEVEALQIGINISELVLTAQQRAQASPVVLAPMFCLMRTLHMQRYSDSLELINALLGCAIVLPKHFDNFGFYRNHDDAVQSKILDIYFHTADWLRVVVCAFATQREPNTRRKVLQRLTHLITIEDQIRAMLAYAPSNYISPQARFTKSFSDNELPRKAPFGRPKGCASKAANQPDECSLIHDIDTQGGSSRLPVAAKAKKPDFISSYGPKELYRPLDVNLLILLQENLVLADSLEADQIGSCLGLKELRFILTDLNSKMWALTNFCPSEASFAPYAIGEPRYFMVDVCEILRHLAKHFRAISEGIQSQLQAVNFVYSNGDLYMERFNYLRACFHLCLRFFANYLAWPEIGNPERAETLQKAFSYMLPAAFDVDQERSVPSMAVKLFNYFLSLEQSVVDISTASSLQELLGTLQKHARTNRSQPEQQDECAEKICALCRHFLQRKWFDYSGALETGAQCNINLDKLLKCCLANSKLNQQQDIFQLVRQEYACVKSGSLRSMPNFKKANFSILFRGMCDALTKHFGERIILDATEHDEKLHVWEQSCTLLNMLLEIAEGLGQTRIFQLFIKHSHLYFKLMLQHGMHILDSCLAQSPARVNALLKNHQNVTRFLHKLCCQSRLQQHVTIVNQIPVLRETVENWVFRIKAVLVAKNCQSAFWMGNLVNKDLGGGSILTPTTSLSEIGSTKATPDSEDELPEDDESLDETALE